MLKREWGAESNGKIRHMFIPSKTATWVSEFAMEDLPLGRISALVPMFAVKDLSFAEHWRSSFPLLSAHHSLYCIWTDLKRSEKIPGAPTWRWGEWIWLTGSSGLHRNSPHGLNIGSIRVFDQIKDPEIPITLRPLYIYNHQRSLASVMNNFCWLW